MNLMIQVVAVVSLLAVLGGAVWPAVFRAEDILSDASLGLVLDGETAHSRFGTWVSSIGDFNGDKLEDIAIGAINISSTYVLLGRNSATSPFPRSPVSMAEIQTGGKLAGQGMRISTSSWRQQSGYPVASVGDLNHDGKSDLFIGASFIFACVAPDCYYRSWVVMGTSNFSNPHMNMDDFMDNKHGFHMTGTESALANAMGGIGDINADGFPDMLFSHYSSQSVHVLLGHQNTTWPHVAVTITSVLDSSLGFTLARTVTDLGSNNLMQKRSGKGGDINGDKINDFIVGNGKANDGMYVIYGHSKTQEPTWKWDNLDVTTLQGDSSGFKVTAWTGRFGLGSGILGDVNGDQIDDMFFATEKYANPSNAVILFGKSSSSFSNSITAADFDGTQGFKLSMPVDETAWNIAGVDINHDGITDIVMGTSNPTLALPGSVYIVFGRKKNITWPANINLGALNGTTGFIIKSEQSSVDGTFGKKLSTAGDFNGDGVEDVMFAAEDFNTSSVGRTYMFWGHAMPWIWKNQMTICNAATVVLNSSNLFIVDNSPSTKQSIVTIVATKHGAFYVAGMQLGLGGTFTFQEVLNGAVSFVHDGSGYAPSYTIQATDSSSNTTTVSTSSVTWLYDIVVDITFQTSNVTQITSAVDAIKQQLADLLQVSVSQVQVTSIAVVDSNHVSVQVVLINTSSSQAVSLVNLITNKQVSGILNTVTLISARIVTDDDASLASHLISELMLAVITVLCAFFTLQ